MKQERISFKVEASKMRKHRALFEADSPFKGKVHDDKHAYKRRPKFHPQYDDQYEE